MPQTQLVPRSLNEAIALYSAFMDTDPNGIFIYSVDGRLVECNKAACEMHGFSKEEMLNMEPKKFIHPDGYQTFLDFQTDLQEKGWFRGESCGITKNGRKFDVEVFGQAIIVNKTPYLYSTIRDITEAKANLIKLIRYEQHLEKMIEERTAALSDALEKLKQTKDKMVVQEKLASLGAMVAGIAHEIKNPINLINNSARMVGKTVEKLNQELETPEENKESISKRAATLLKMSEIIVNNGKRADKILKSMLRQSRSGEVELVPTNLKETIAEALHLAHLSQTSESAFSFEQHLELADIDSYLFYQQDLNRAFINIFENSLYALREKQKENPTGFIPRIEVALKTNQATQQIELVIKDNGNGIPDAIKNKVLEPFFTTKPTGEGTGLGLSMVNDIITQEHQGNLQIDSHAGEYTKILISLPMNLKRETPDDFAHKTS